MTSALIDILTANQGTLINVSSALASCRCRPRQSTAPRRRRFTPTPNHCGSIGGNRRRGHRAHAPAVNTELTGDLPEDNGVTLMTRDELVKQSFASFKAG